jgi:ribonuclease HI
MWKDVQIKNLAFGLPKGSTVFQAEVAAIKEAAKYMSSTNLPEAPKDIKFFVDSQAALLSLIAPELNSLTVVNAIKELNHLGLQCNRIKIVWIKAHVAHKGNERADSLAKLGTTSNTTLPVGIPTSALKAEIKEIFIKKWEGEWKTYPHARQTKQFFPLLDK